MTVSPKLIQVLRRTLLAAAFLVTAIAIVVTVENWRGDRAWRACESDLVARGFGAARIKAIPAERDLFAADVIKAIAAKPYPVSATYDRFASPAVQKVWDAVFYTLSLHPWDATKARQMVRESLKTERPPSENPADDLRAALKPADGFLDDVCAAVVSRPEATWPMDDPLMQRFNWMRYRHVIQLLGIRARTELATGDRELAARDLATALGLADRLVEARSTLVNIMTAEVCYRYVAEIVQDGCAEHRWDAEQLGSLQERLGSLRPLARLQEPSPTSERLAILRTLDTPPPVELKRDVPWWLFHGWVQRNKVALSDFSDAYSRAIDPAADAIDPHGFATLQTLEAGVHSSRSPYTHLLRQANMSDVLPKIANVRDKLAADVLSLAVERFYLAHQQYPTHAEELVPRYTAALPRAALTGKPAELRGTADGKYEIVLGTAKYRPPTI